MDDQDGINNRSHAQTWAIETVDKLNIPKVDAPYMIAVLVEAALMELPLRVLHIAVNPDGTRYLITISGYSQMLDLVKWTSTFMGAERGQELSRVRGLYLQIPPSQGAYLVIDMEQAKWHDDGGGRTETHHHRRGYRKKRTD